MKKLISLILCAALIFTLAACSGNENTGKETTDADVNISETENNETTEKETEEKEKNVARGTITDDVYTNEFAEFTFTKPSTWVYLTDEEISESINAGQDVMDLSSIEKALAEKSSLYDMAAMDSFGNNVLICYENTMISGFKKVTAEEYVDLLDNSLSNIDGFSYNRTAKEDIKFGDTEFKKVVYELTVEGTDMTQAYYVRAIDKYVVAIIVTATTTDIADIEAMLG